MFGLYLDIMDLFLNYVTLFLMWRLFRMTCLIIKVKCCAGINNLTACPE